MGNRLATCIQARFVLILTVVLGMLGGVLPGYAQPSFDTAVVRLQQNQPQQARELLQEEVAVRPSALAYANLAAAELALRNYGEAIYAFEMAQALGGFSGSEAFRQNLQQHLPPEHHSLSASPWRKSLAPVIRLSPQNFWAALAALCLIGLTVLLAAQLLGRSILPPTRNTQVIVVLLLIGALALVLAKAQSSWRNPGGVVVMSGTAMYEAPSTQSKRLQTIKAGAAFQGGELLNDLILVTLPTGEQGWVPAQDLRWVEVTNLKP